MARGIQSKSIEGLGAETPAEGVGGKALHEPVGLGGRKLPNIHFFLNSSKSQTNLLRMLNTKSAISQKLKIATTKLMN